MTPMNLPTNAQCRRIYRMIQAHCAVRASTGVGHALRALVGKAGDIAELNPAVIEKHFVGKERAEAQRLRLIAIRIKQRYGHGQNRLSND